MVLVFILLGIIILLLSLFIIILLSTIQIEIKNLKIGNKEKNQPNRIKDKYEIKIGLYLLEKLPILWFRLNNKKMKKIYNSKQLEKIDLKKIEKQIPFNKETLKLIKNIKIAKVYLRIDLGTEDAILTSYITAFVASIIGIILPHVVKKDTIKNCNYIVNPKYQDRNEYHIYFEGIIQIKIVHIIYSMLNFVKKGRKKHERTSNRRSYAYRYE